ncbi:GNAT family N-acetyltransferase [Halorubrum sp. JWXQ-INN 858]|uniref:arsenic resistance N-acetyltransferase ArsN2 n=1 Tax=Halorubrum sp. JWXQ-INN 858 TaxID=2690782 RepID=UPI00135AF88F|nr:arsenic resistance N-acetyltransferase ArsN2 [Halorubrum sp. JWXQ-INN 858]MWV65287.1 GNAT family N-acetyltransferase [Halorubrum sp. JWXQ-INN 858]
MVDPTVTLRPAETAGRIGTVERLLRDNGLPTDDVRSKPEAFSLAVHDGETIGVGGVETFGSVGLLRSVVVADGVRGRGYGTAVCDALETAARDAGVVDCFLLTTTATAFFEGRGYGRVARAAVPDAIRETAQFADYCPASATVMHKRLADD